MRRWIGWTLAALLLFTGAGLGLTQDATEDDRTARTREERREAIRERIRRAIRLPRTTEEAREEGVDEEKVQEVLRTGRERGVPAGDMQEILEEENRAMRDGTNENFGAAVQEMKAEGLRGRELAAAIHAEQMARGMKKPKKQRGAWDDEAARPDDDPYRGGHDSDDKSKGKAETKGKGQGKSKGKGR